MLYSNLQCWRRGIEFNKLIPNFLNSLKSTGYNKFVFQVNSEILKTNPQSVIAELIKDNIVSHQKGNLDYFLLPDKFKFIGPEGGIENFQSYGTCSVTSLKIAIESCFGQNHNHLAKKIINFIHNTNLSSLITEYGIAINELDSTLKNNYTISNYLFKKKGFSPYAKELIVNSHAEDFAREFLFTTNKSATPFIITLELTKKFYAQLLKPLIQNLNAIISSESLELVDKIFQNLLKISKKDFNEINFYYFLNNCKEDILTSHLNSLQIIDLKSSLISTTPELKIKFGFDIKDDIEFINHMIYKNISKYTTLTNSLKRDNAPPLEINGKIFPPTPGMMLLKLYKKIAQRDKILIKDFSDKNIDKLFYDVINTEYLNAIQENDANDAIDKINTLLAIALEQSGVENLSDPINRNIVENCLRDKVKKLTIILGKHKDYILYPIKINYSEQEPLDISQITKEPIDNTTKIDINENQLKPIGAVFEEDC